MNHDYDDLFRLYDIKVEVIPSDRPFICEHHTGDYFTVEGEKLFLPNGQGFSLYALSAILPLIPAKQRPFDDNDWMATDWEIACPDPLCGARFKISRRQLREFHRSKVSGVKIKNCKN